MLWIDQKYVGLISQRLDKFKQKSNKLWNFRCCLCGDSKKDKNKARAFFLVHKDLIFFKCHNCTRSMHLSEFIRHLDPSLANAYNLEKYSTNQQRATNVVIPPDKKLYSLLDAGAIPARESIHAMDYLHTRYIPENRIDDLYYIRDMSWLAKLNSDYEGRLVPEERILIPFEDWDGKLIGLTGRALGNSKKRYVNVRLQEGMQFYGLKYIEKKKERYVVEGAFDSMFVANCVSFNNSSLHNLYGYTIIYDNEPRNKDIVQCMHETVKRQDTKMVIWPKDFQFKDINQAIMAGVTREEIQELIYSNTFEKLELKLKFEQWKR